MAESVVLLHGITDQASTMAVLEQRLTDEGYRVRNLSYPSTAMNLAGCAEYLHPHIDAFLSESDGPAHLVGHSMGGLVIRQYLDQYPNERVQRVVMLGTPNHGSEVADLLRNVLPYRWFYGPAGQQLCTDHEHPQLPPRVEAAVIAGIVSTNPLAVGIFRRGANDSRVSVESSRLDTPHTHIALPVDHQQLRYDPAVQDHVVSFLKEGRFA